VNTIRGTPGSDGRGGNNNDNNQRPPTPSSSGNNSPQNTQAPQPSAQVVADTRLNQILVVAAPADYTYVASLIAEFDKPLEVAEPFERKLKYAAALDVLSAVVDLLQDPNTGTTQLPGGGTVQQQRQQALASNSSQLLGGRNTQGSRGGTVGSTAAASSDTATATTSSGLGSRADVISGPSEDNAPVSVLVGKTRVIADPMANCILVIGPKESIDKATGLLDKLDRKPAQVYLATVIGQLTLSDGMTSGIDYVSGLSRAGDGTDFTASGFTNRTDALGGVNGVGRAINDLRNNFITTPFGPASGLNLYGAVGDSLEIFVTALETNNNFKILSRPSVFALNNKKAVITSGRQIPVPSQQTVFANNNAAQGNTTTTIEYRDVVLKLEVVPLINSDGEVTLTIAQVNDTVVGTQLVQPNEVPIIGTEQLVTTVTVPDRNTIVLGGLISEEKTRDKQGLPVLGRIPGLGKLFRTDTDSTVRKELIVFIQPQVVTDDIGVRNTSLNEDLRTKVGGEAAQRFPQKVVPAAPPPPPKKKNFLQRMFSREDDEL
jgi:type II secretory pathway component GspD/PulD (secretin)